MSRLRTGPWFAVPLLLSLILSVAGVSTVPASTCQDLDGDGYGSPGDATCPAGPAEDCDDGNATVYPGAPEFCDGLNNDCRDAHWPTLRTFAASNISTTTAEPRSIFAADVDGDGDVDTLSASYNDKIAWHENITGDGTVWAEHLISTAADLPRSVFAADVDGDGDTDALSAVSHMSSKIAWHENVWGDGTTWSEHAISISTVANGAYSVFAADVDGDGDTDALSTSYDDDKVAWHENVAGDGSIWTEQVISTAADGANSVFAADVDGDGHTDVLSASYYGMNTVRWYENVAGDGSTWTEQAISADAHSTWSVFAADVDGDGDTDALSASYWGAVTVAWFENVAGDGTAWTEHAISTAADGAYSVFAADVDGDGDTDILLGSPYGVSWLENVAGDGTAWTERGITAAAIGARVFAADVDGDGDVDALSTSLYDYKIAWYENVAGDGTAWMGHLISTAADGAKSVFAADGDGDGDTDALSASSYDDKIAWYSNFDIEFEDGDGLSECAGDCDDGNANCTTDCTDGDGDRVYVCAGDCDDAVATVYPTAPQICDGLNNDCDHPAWPGLMNTTESDEDGDGLSECAGDCDDGSINCTTDCTDGDGDGVRACAGDCDDTRAHCTTDCTDADTDGWCVTTDCDDTNPLALSAPGEVSALEAEEITGGVRLTWESQAATAGAGTVYDLFWGFVLSLSAMGGDFSTGACFDEDLADPYLDYLGPDPPPGDALYFMVRGQNACPGGTGTYGTPNRDTTAALSPSPCN